MEGANALISQLHIADHELTRATTKEGKTCLILHGTNHLPPKDFVFPREKHMVPCSGNGKTSVGKCFACATNWKSICGSNWIQPPSGFSHPQGPIAMSDWGPEVFIPLALPPLTNGAMVPSESVSSHVSISANEPDQPDVQSDKQVWETPM